MISALGSFGIILWFVFAFIFVTAPCIALDLPSWVSFLLFFVVGGTQFGLFIGSGLYIWAFVEVIKGPQDWIAIVFYVLFALYMLCIVWPLLWAIIATVAEAKQSKAEARQEKHEVYCEHCGAKIERGDQFCRRCGGIQQSYTELITADFTKSIPPKKNPLSAQEWFALFAIVLFLVGIIYTGIQFIGQPESPATRPTPTPKPTVRLATPTPKPTVKVAPAQVMPSNGHIFKDPTYVKLCPLTVSVRGDNGYYIRLKYMYKPESYNSRHIEGNPAVLIDDYEFFVRPGQSVELEVPVGVYKLYYASGEKWYGRAKMFGEDTGYFTSSELLSFYTDYTTFYGHTLELWLQSGGNFDTHEIDANKFFD